MFKFEELCELIRLVGSTEVAMVEIEHAGGKLRIDGKAPAPVMTMAPTVGEVPIPTGQVMAEAPQFASENSADSAAAGGTTTEEDLHFVVSPIVGTFYRAPNPDAEPYVKVGDSIESGKTLCIVEAMKLMNEIESDASGTIVKVFAENAQPVEFGERLFALRLS